MIKEIKQYPTAITALNLFDKVNATAYFDLYGGTPPYYPSFPIKYWVGEMPEIPYTYFDRISGTLKAFDTHITATFDVNIPTGILRFPKYHVRSTDAFITDTNKTPISPRMLSLKHEALSLNEELGGVFPLIENKIARWLINWGDEARRIWNIGVWNVGLLLARQNAHGVGRPGNWNLDNPVQPHWEPDMSVVPLFDPRVIPVPTRELLSWETIRAIPFGFVLDKVGIVQITSPSVTLESLDAKLDQILALGNR